MTSGTFGLHSVLVLLAFWSVPSTSSIYPLISRPTLMAQTPMPAVILPPLAHNRAVGPATPSIMLPMVARRKLPEMQSDIAQEEEPSCAELKTMWRKMRHIARQMEITNQVPRLQNPFITSAYTYRQKYPDSNPYSIAKSSSLRVFQDPKGQHPNEYPKPILSRNFGKIIRDPDEHRFYKVKNKLSGPSGLVKNPSHLGFDGFGDDYPNTASYNERGSVPGRFSNNPLPEEALGIYGTVVRTPEERAKYRQKSRPRTGNGYRSRLSGFDHGPIGRVPFRATKPHGGYSYGTEVTHMPRDRAVSRATYARNPAAAGFAEIPTEIGQITSGSPTRVERIDKLAGFAKIKNSCQRVLTKICKTDVDCFCIGEPKLFCGGMRCRPRYRAQKYNKTPSWGKSLFADPDTMNFVEFGFKRDPLWPAPF